MSRTGSSDFLVFLDRDGTIIEDRHYLSDPEGVVLLAGAADGLRTIQALGGRLVVVTNQSGIGRGYFDRSTVDAVNARMRDLLKSEGVQVAGIYLCPHVPGDKCACRKPRTLMLEKAAADENLPLHDSFMIGDRLADVEAGRRIGARTILVSGAGAGVEKAGAEAVVSDLVESAAFIASLRSRGVIDEPDES